MIAKDQKEFEKKMFGLGNKIIEIGKSEGGYSYEFGDGGWGSSGLDSMPTSDSRYEKKWLFPDNKIYTSSQIEANGLDKDFAIRNSLQPINKDSIKGFIYLENLSLLHKTYDIHSSFGHNYNKEESTASTFYDLKITEREMIYPDASPKNIWYSSLSIFYVNREKYLNTIREVQEKCEYIETKQMYTGEYQTIYQYRNFTVKTNEGSEYGGNISIHFNIDS
ncbi:hypothetical protein N8987_03440 [Crocinitomix sp.]|nr:hypothetical protein [Crocinitomix sp.]